MDLFIAKAVLDLLDFFDEVLDKIERWAYGLVGVEFDSPDEDTITCNWKDRHDVEAD